MKKFFFIFTLGSLLITVFAKIDAMETKNARPNIKAINNDEPGYDSNPKKIITIVEYPSLSIPLDEKHFSVEQGQEHIKLPLELVLPIFAKLCDAYREESYTPNSAKSNKIPVALRETFEDFSRDFYIRGLAGKK